MHDNPDMQKNSHFEYVIPTNKLTDSTKIAPSKPNPEKVKKQALEYMSQLTGWCPQEKALFLVDLILKNPPEVVLEIGVFGGKSLIPMACALRANKKGKIYGIDPWDSYESTQWMKDDTNRAFWNAVDHEGILRDLVQKIDQFQLEDQIELIRSTSEAAELIENIDILHVDGNHSEETSYLDVIKWVPQMKTGGVIILDDIHWSEAGVNTTDKAIRWLDANCSKLAEFNELTGWAVWRKL